VLDVFSCTGESLHSAFTLVFKTAGTFRLFFVTYTSAFKFGGLLSNISSAILSSNDNQLCTLLSDVRCQAYALPFTPAGQVNTALREHPEVDQLL
jgi:hypothetical protein